jgi:hypothetical protein
MTHPAVLDGDDLLSKCLLERSRSGGPGGQHRNKVETKVTITHEPTGISAQAGERRSVAENRPVALFRLRLALATQVRCPVPAGECRSALWLSRCSGGRVSCNPEHHDFPALLAEALDVLHSVGLDPRKGAVRLGCSTSQLVRLVKDHPPAFERWNREREARGLHPMH